MQRLEHRLRFALADDLALIGMQLLALALEVMELGDEFRCVCRHRALVSHMQLKEPAPRTCPATDLRDGLTEQPLVARKVVTHQCPLPALQETEGVGASACSQKS